MNPTAAALGKAAEAGITSILATPGSDGIRGQSALVFTALGADVPQIGALADERRGGLVIKPVVALHVGTADRPAGGDAYPNSLMGVIAFNRQAFLDAQWYQQARPKPHSRRRSTPCSRRSAGSMPVAFRASTAREILRALDMAKAFKLDPIITTARQVDAVTARAEGRQRARDLQPELPDAAGLARAGCRRIAQRAARARQRAEVAGRARQGRRAVRVRVKRARAIRRTS